jgi:hypothetical protein
MPRVANSVANSRSSHDLNFYCCAQVLRAPKNSHFYKSHPHSVYPRFALRAVARQTRISRNTTVNREARLPRPAQSAVLFLNCIRPRQRPFVCLGATSRAILSTFPLHRSWLLFSSALSTINQQRSTAPQPDRTDPEPTRDPTGSNRDTFWTRKRHQFPPVANAPRHS